MDQNVIVELYRGASPDAVGTPLEDWDGTLDAATTEWLAAQGYGNEDPDLWVLIRTEEFAPDNRPIASREMAVPRESTYTAWLTTDWSALEGEMCDVSVLANDADGSSTGTGPLWHAVTTVPSRPAEGRDDDALILQAKVLLAAAGWQTEGPGDVMGPESTRRRQVHGLTDITKEEALSEILRWKAEYPGVVPEVTAVWLLRQVEDWEEHRAVLKALDEVLASEVVDGVPPERH